MEERGKLKTVEPTEDEIRLRLAAQPPLVIERPGFQPAAVLVPLFPRDGHWNVLLTRRTRTVEKHKGEISFPGGHQDPEDADLSATALREAEEEVGIPGREVRILGRLDEIITLTRFRIRPYAGVIPYPFTVRSSPEEIAEVITLPLIEFQTPQRYLKRSFTAEGKDYPVYYYQVAGYIVWGATAKILRQFLERAFLFGEPKPREPEPPKLSDDWRPL